MDTNTFITEENREKLENAKKTNSVEVILFCSDKYFSIS